MRAIGRPWSMIAVGVFLLLVISRIPASAVSWFLPSAVGMTGLSGTLWSGQALRSWWGFADQHIVLGRVEWQIEPWRMFWSTPLSFNSEWGGQRLEARLAYLPGGHIRLTDAYLNFDTQMLRALLPFYIDGRFSGRFWVVELEGKQVRRASGKALLDGAVWTAKSGDIPLGSYHLDVDSGLADGVVVGVMKTLGGSLQLAGEVTLRPNAYQISLQAAGPVAVDDSFRGAVAMLATPTSTGFTINLEGTY
jgi:general secretion pathway protein N